jgi:hypothetical protein
LSFYFHFYQRFLDCIQPTNKLNNQLTLGESMKKLVLATLLLATSVMGNEKPQNYVDDLQIPSHLPAIITDFYNTESGEGFLYSYAAAELKDTKIKATSTEKLQAKLAELEDDLANGSFTPAFKDDLQKAFQKSGICGLSKLGSTVSDFMSSTSNGVIYYRHDQVWEQINQGKAVLKGADVKSVFVGSKVSYEATVSVYVPCAVAGGYADKLQRWLNFGSNVNKKFFVNGKFNKNVVIIPALPTKSFNY